MVDVDVLPAPGCCCCVEVLPKEKRGLLAVAPAVFPGEEEEDNFVQHSLTTERIGHCFVGHLCNHDSPKSDMCRYACGPRPVCASLGWSSKNERGVRAAKGKETAAPSIQLALAFTPPPSQQQSLSPSTVSVQRTAARYVLLLQGGRSSKPW